MTLKETRPLIIYHSDIDGHASGAILQKYLKDRNPIMIQMNYDDTFPWELVTGETEVWMTDFSLQPWDNMVRLHRSCKKLIWIDHHKSAIQYYNDWLKNDGSPIEGLLKDGRAACGLCWDYCNPELPEPLPIHLAECYDVWKWQEIEGAIEFQYGTKFYETDPGTLDGQNFWKCLLEQSSIRTAEIISYGELLIKYKERSNSTYIKDNCFETTLDKLNVIAVNRKENSQQFDSIWNPLKYHAMLAFTWAKGIWTISLYTTRDDVDVSVIAKKHGGGGHKRAAGFQAKELPFELK